MTSLDGFPHHRLVAYQTALDLVEAAVHLIRTCPRGFTDLRDQLRRAALATVRHIAEGAACTSPADKRARFAVARGECAEADAILETAARPGLYSIDEINRVRRLAHRASALLTGLIRREGSRLRSASGARV